MSSNSISNDIALNYLKNAIFTSIKGIVPLKEDAGVSMQLSRSKTWPRRPGGK